VRLVPVSWLEIAKGCSMSSPHTAQSYVERLQDLLAVKVFHLLSPNFRVMYRKNKKIHLTDPFFYQVFSSYTGVEILEETVVESTVACHLSRVFESYFWRNGTEVDIVSMVGKEQVGFEIKWGPKSWRKPRHLKRVFVLTKEILPLFLSSALWS